MTERELRLGYVGFTATDLDEWKSFAESVLGGECTLEGGRLRVRLDDHWMRISVEETSDPSQADVAYAGWETDGEAHFDELVAHVVACGIAVEHGDSVLCASRGVQGLAHFLDCDGLRTEIVWGPHVHSLPWSPRRRHHGYVTGSLGLGHVVLAAGSRQASEDFYRDVLGFALADYGSGPLVFMSSNQRHHSVAFLPAEMEGRGKRLVHLMLQTRELDDVGIAFDACLNGAAPISQVLGRHTNDLSFSFYLVTPSGVEIEYGWGARTRGDAWVTNRYLDRDVWGHQSVQDVADLLARHRENGES